MPDEYGNGNDGPCSTSSSTTRPTLTHADLLFVVQAPEPPGEFVRTLNLPRHGAIMPFKE